MSGCVTCNPPDIYIKNLQNASNDFIYDENNHNFWQDLSVGSSAHKDEEIEDTRYFVSKYRTKNDIWTHKQTYTNDHIKKSYMFKIHTFSTDESK